MKVKSARLLALSLLAFASGCASVHVAKEYHGVRVEDGRAPVATVEIENSGWFLFSFIPIGSGDPEQPNKVACRWFRDTVHLESNMRLLDSQMKAAGATEAENLTSHRTDEKYLLILLERRSYHTSAVLTKTLEGNDKK